MECPTNEDTLTTAIYIPCSPALMVKEIMYQVTVANAVQAFSAFENLAIYSDA